MKGDGVVCARPIGRGPLCKQHQRSGPTSAAYQAGLILGRATALAAGLVIFDAAVTRVPSELAWIAIPTAAREQVVSYVLTLAASLAVLVPATSFAVTGLGEYAPVSLLLLRPYAVTRVDQLREWVTGRSNPFRSLILWVLVLLVSSVTLRLAGTFGLSGSHIPTLAVLAGVAMWSLFRLVYFLYWVIGMRQPDEAMRHLEERVSNALQHAATLRDADMRRRPPSRGGAYICEYEEQQEVKEYCQALGQIAQRGLAQGQMFVAFQAIEALGAIQKKVDSVRTDLPSEWWKIRTYGAQSKPSYWLDQLVIRGLGDILTGAVDQHHYGVGELASEHLTRIGKALPGVHPDLARLPLYILLLQFEYATDECVQVGERWLRDELLSDFGDLIVNVACAADPWPQRLVAYVPEMIEETTHLAVAANDVQSVRRSLSLVDKIVDALPVASGSAFKVLCKLGGLAMLSRAYDSGSVLVDWLVPRAGRLNGATPASQELFSPTDHETAEADAIRVFLILAASRSAQLGPMWPESMLTSARVSLEALPGRVRRARRVMQRMAAVARYPREEAKEWDDKLTELAAHPLP